MEHKGLIESFLWNLINYHRKINKSEKNYSLKFIIFYLNKAYLILELSGYSCNYFIKLY